VLTLTFWTALVIIVLGGPLDGEVTYLLYPSHDACLAAHQTVSATLPYDHRLACEQTRMASSSIRPMPRPTKH